MGRIRLPAFRKSARAALNPKNDREADCGILALLDMTPPKSYANWSGPLIAKALGDVDMQYVWRFSRA